MRTSLQAYKTWKLAKVVVKLWERGSAFWRDDERPCIIQRELSAAPALPGITCLSRVHLCALWKIFINQSNFAWLKMWLFCIVTGRCCSEICEFV